VGKSKTVMLSTHIMQEVEILCDRVIIINKGKIVTDKQTVTLQQGDEQRMLISIEFDKPADEKKLKALQGVESVKNIKGNSWRLVTKPDMDIRPGLFKFAVDNGLSILEMQREEKKLEDVFKELTK
jgi:ABC-2 type transport system ATP-binding protein